MARKTECPVRHVLRIMVLWGELGLVARADTGVGRALMIALMSRTNVRGLLAAAKHRT